MVLTTVIAAIAVNIFVLGLICAKRPSKTDPYNTANIISRECNIFSKSTFACFFCCGCHAADETVSPADAMNIATLLSSFLLAYTTKGTKDEWITPSLVGQSLACIQAPFWVYLIKVANDNFRKYYRQSKAEAKEALAKAQVHEQDPHERRHTQRTRAPKKAAAPNSGTLTVQFLTARLQRRYLTANPEAATTVFSAAVCYGGLRKTSTWRSWTKGKVFWTGVGASNKNRSAPGRLHHITRGAKVTVQIYARPRSADCGDLTVLLGEAAVQVGEQQVDDGVPLDAWVELYPPPQTVEGGTGTDGGSAGDQSGTSVARVQLTLSFELGEDGEHIESFEELVDAANSVRPA